MLVCFIVSTTSYAAMAVLGYLMFGSKVESQVTLNLPTNKTSAKVAIYTTHVNPFAKFALMVKPIVSSLENRLSSRPNRRRSTLIRTGITLSLIVVGITIPFFGYLMSLVGAFVGVTGWIILPCVFFLNISGILPDIPIRDGLYLGGYIARWCNSGCWYLHSFAGDH